MPYIATETPKNRVPRGKAQENKLPPFVYTVSVVTLFSWIYLYYFVANNAPDSTGVILNGIFLFSLALSFTFSLVFFRINHRKITKDDPKQVYRQALKRGAYMGFGIGFFLFVKAFVLK